MSQCFVNKPPWFRQKLTVSELSPGRLYETQPHLCTLVIMLSTHTRVRHKHIWTHTHPPSVGVMALSESCSALQLFLFAGETQWCEWMYGVKTVLEGDTGEAPAAFITMPLNSCSAEPPDDSLCTHSHLTSCWSFTLTVLLLLQYTHTHTLIKADTTLESS